MEANNSVKIKSNDWQTPSYKSVQKSALFCSNTFVLKPRQGSKSKAPFEALHSDVASLPSNPLRMAVIAFFVAICKGKDGPSLGLPANIEDGVIKRAWFSPERGEILITCSSMFFKRTLKRILNKSSMVYNSVDGSSVPHRLVARDHLPDASHRFYHRACRAIRRLTAKLFRDNLLLAAWVNPVPFMVNNKPIFAPRISLSWYDGSPQTCDTVPRSRISILLHPGVRRAPDSIARRQGAVGSTLQLESRLNLFPGLLNRPGSHWENLFLASIKRSLAAADLASSNTDFPLPPTRLGDFIDPKAPFYQPSTCLSQGASARPSLPPPPPSTAQPLSPVMPKENVLLSASNVLPPPPTPPAPPELSPTVTSAGFTSKDVNAPSPTPSSPSAEDLQAVGWPSLAQASSVRSQRKLSPMVYPQSVNQSRLPAISLQDYLLPGSAFPTDTPRRSARLRKRNSDTAR